jgi:hypothetical protein
MATDGPDPIPCDQEIYDRGEPVCMTHSISSNRMEAFVRSVAVSTGQRVDWHFMGGRAVVLVIGDADKVRASIGARLSDLRKLQCESYPDLVEMFIDGSPVLWL